MRPAARVLVFAACVSASSFDAGAEAAEEHTRDASIDRVLLLPTAELQPAGTFELGLIEAVMPQATLAPADWIQLTLSGVPPVVPDQPSFADLTAKLAIARGGRLRAAVMVSGFGAHYDGSFAAGARAALVADLCLGSEGCPHRISVSIHGVASDHANEAVPVAAGLGWTGRISELVALLLEVEGGSALGSGKSGVKASDTALVGYGARLMFGPAAIDLGFLRPLAGLDTGSFFPGLPFIAASLRLTEP